MAIIKTVLLKPKSEVSEIKTHYAVIKVQTKEKYQFIDLTAKIKEIVKESKISSGIVNIVSRHTTTAILLNENESLLLADFLEKIKNFFVYEAKSHYRHDDIELRKRICPALPGDECQNADAHCRSIFLTNSQTLNIVNGELDLGYWQSLLFVELDRGKDREISVMVMGEEKKNSSPDNVVSCWPAP